MPKKNNRELQKRIHFEQINVVIRLSVNLCAFKVAVHKCVPYAINFSNFLPKNYALLQQKE